MRRDVFAREPLSFRGTIPVFSESSEYTDNYEQIAADHLASFHRDGTNPWIKEYLWVQMENSTVDLIKKHSKPNDMVLDVGVGLGRLLSHFPTLQRYGIDISFGYLEIAQSKGIDVCYAMVEDMPYKRDLFDVVVCTDVLEHVLDLNLACAKILSVLKEGGFLIVRVPFREDLSPYLDPTYPYQYAHLRNFDENSLCLLFERVFNCEYIDMATAGYDYEEGGTRLKCQFRFPRRDRILARLLSTMKAIHTSTYEALLQKLYYPVEINMAFRKI
jgi:SAM-dependent methyltransferase